MKTELTLAIPTDHVWNILDYVKNGVIKISNSKIIDQLLVKGLFRHRNELEDDSLYKQLIPYAVICYKDMIYMFHRTKKQTETRLHNMYSLGVGGHMNPWGESINIKYMHHELTRELNEEVQLYDNCKIESIVPIGLINDDTNDVGKVHLGVLYQIHLNCMDLEINEKEKMTGQWINISELKAYYSEMESWSKIYIDTVL